MPRTARIGFRQLIWALGLLGVVGIVALAGVYFTTAALLAREEAVADGAAEIERLVLTLDSQLLEARRAEKDFLLRTDERYVTRHAEIAERSTALLGAIEKKLTSSDDAVMRDLLTGGRTGFGAYLRAFQVVVAAQRKLGHDENSGLQGSLRNSVRDAEGQLAKANEKELTILMLMMRRHEKDFILREDARYLGEMKKRGEEFASSLKSSSLGDAARESVSAKMAAYQRDFASYAGANTEKADAVKALSKAYADVEPVFNTLHEAVGKRYRDASASIAAVRARTDTLMIGGVAAVLVILLVVGQLIARSISRPIAALAATTKALSEGDLSVEVGGRSRCDEIGMMAQSLDVFRAAMIESRRLEDASKASEAEALVERRRARLELATTFESKVGGLVQSVSAAATEMEATAQVMTETAQQTATQSVGVASAAGQTSANVQTVAVATEELSSSIREISEQVAKSSTIAGRAAEEAKRTDATVQALAAGAQKIGDVVALINNIAGQTNLLALNATIEAARAGEAGRGFAVVATEVKALASQTAKATEEIAAQIDGIQAETQQVVAAIQTIGATIDEMNVIASGVAAAMEEQGAATQEIARNVQQAAQGTQVVTGNILDVKRGADETGSAASQVLMAAQELARHSEDLGREVDTFLSVVKTA